MIDPLGIVALTLLIITPFLIGAYQDYKAKKERKTRETPAKITPEKKKIVQEYKNALEKTRKKFVSITATKTSKKLNQIESKFGGTPYLKDKDDWPKDEHGKQLFFLAQINFEDIPSLENFPTSGLIQFFIGTDDVMGLKFQKDPPFDNTYKVIYHEKINENNTFKETPQDAVEYPPFEGNFKLKFELKESFISLEDYHLYNQISDKQFLEQIDYDKGGIVKQTLGLSLGNDVSTKHQIGGYPFFTQSDPRDSKGTKSLESEGNEFILLFQIDSQFDPKTKKSDIIFGDSGVMNFFIREHDLKKKIFSKVIYTWDCY